MNEAPRINKWARMVVEIDRISRDGGVFIVQTPMHCNNILITRGRLLRIYLTYWDHVDIGYPNTIEILRRWAVDPSETVENPIKFIRDLEMYVKCIDLDTLAVDAAVDDQAEQEELKNAELQKEHIDRLE